MNKEVITYRGIKFIVHRRQRGAETPENIPLYIINKLSSRALIGGYNTIEEFKTKWDETHKNSICEDIDGEQTKICDKNIKCNGVCESCRDEARHNIYFKG